MKPPRSLSDEAKRIRLDLLMSWWPFTDGSLRASVEVLIEEAKRDTWSPERESELLRYAEASWPARQAARRFAAASPEILWQALVPRCLPTTQVLLKRLAEYEGHQRFHDLLRAPQADFALHEAERSELQLLLPQIYALLWRDHKEDMVVFVKEAEAERQQVKAMLHGKTESGVLSAYEHAMMYGEHLG